MRGIGLGQPKPPLPNPHTTLALSPPSSPATQGPPGGWGHEGSSSGHLAREPGESLLYGRRGFLPFQGQEGRKGSGPQTSWSGRPHRSPFCLLNLRNQLT